MFFYKIFKMKKILTLIILVASSWIAKGQQTLTINGNFINQSQAVVNQEITVIYNSLDSSNLVIGYDTTMTDSQGVYSFTKTVPGTIFQGYAIVKTTDCFGSTQEMYGVFLPGLNTAQINFECVNLCINSYVASIDSIPGIGLMAKFKSNSARSTSVFNWSFGDGTSGTGSYVDHVYASPGTYMVCLTTTDSIGACTYTYCDSVLVSNFINQCYSAFSYYQDSVNAKLIYFTGQTFNAPGSIISWDFGDGFVASGSNNVTHVYAQEGIYNVCLGYFDIIQNCFTTYCDVVYVDSISSPNCNAEFKMFMIPDSVTLGANVVYFSSINQNSTSTYTWDFGDGSFSSGPFTTHIFNNLGIYDVCLKIDNFSTNCSDTVCKRIEIVNQGMKILGIQNSRYITINSLYPNPTDGISYLTLNSKLAGNAIVKIYSLKGRLISQWNKELFQGENKFDFDLTSVQAGMYFIEIITNGDRVSAKLMIK